MFEGKGVHQSLVCYACVRLWNSNKWTEWDEISRNRAPYMTDSELEEVVHTKILLYSQKLIDKI